ncbi:MAG: Hsp70 family protein, partial [Proteobacteria bacterium]|nr:Hsp70 family protein [Pseudomonadota bacterium]
CTFVLDARSEAGTALPVTPAQFTIVQGLTIGDPPLSRTLGVALVSGMVRVYLERGAPLPARRTFTHHTIETIAKGSSDSVLRIPIVQGEMHQAEMCRHVGTLDISGDAISDTVPTGSEVEVTIELDRGGRLSARALIPAIGQAFEHVAHLLVEDASPESLEASIRDLRNRLVELRTDAFRRGMSQSIEKLDRIESRLAEAERDIDAAHGGDADAGQRARRALLDVDATMSDADLARKWPALDESARATAIWASSAVSEHGTDPERALLQEVLAAMDRARKDKDAPELERQMTLANRLATAANRRDEDYWGNRFTYLSRVVTALWNLMPDDPEARKRGFDSGVR